MTDTHTMLFKLEERIRHLESQIRDDTAELEAMDAALQMSYREERKLKERVKRLEEAGDKMLEATVDLGFIEFTKFSKAWKEAKETA